MQTYEIAPDESMEMLVRTLSRMVRRDKDLVLVIPPGVNPFTGVESVTKLKGVMRSYDARLQVQAADPAVAALFQEAGIPVSPLTAQALAPPPPQAAAPRPPAGPLPFPAPANPPQPAVQHFVPSDQAPQRGGDLPADIANMNFDLEDVGHPTPHNPAPYVPAPPQKGGFLQKLMGRSTPPTEPAPERPRPNADQPLPQPDWAQSGDGPESADLFGEGPTGLDVTMPEWLRDAPPEPPAAGNRVVGRLPTSNLDVTMPQIGGNAPSAGPGTGDLGVPSWLAEYGQSNPPPAPLGASQEAQGPSAASAMPAWLAEEAGAGPAAPVDTGGDLGGLPEWLRDETPVAPPIQPGPYSAPAPAWPTANAAPSASQAAAPPPALSAPAAPAPAAQPNAGAGLGGPEQTPESIAQAVRAAGLDARTRALLIFGMALVRLAPGEAAAGAAAARQAGCSKEELQLVVEMAQALGGGPSERLGRKILGSQHP
ncbi:MAG TPA: carboxymuconolactone decarboxylase family protein [Chloroflexia bacterium]